MKKLIFTAGCLISLLFNQSCADKSSEKESCTRTFELNANNPHDTVNKTDCNGLKQGKWVPNSTNKLTTTTYYSNDSVVNSQ